jgi:hypothetical protein
MVTHCSYDMLDGKHSMHEHVLRWQTALSSHGRENFDYLPKIRFRHFHKKVLMGNYFSGGDYSGGGRIKYHEISTAVR